MEATALMCPFECGMDPRRAHLCLARRVDAAGRMVGGCAGRTVRRQSAEGLSVGLFLFLDKGGYRFRRLC